MEIEILNATGRWRISHLVAEKIRIKHGSKLYTLELAAGDLILSTADSEDSTKTLIMQPIHTNKIKIL